MHFLRNASLCLMVGLLTSCGGSSQPPDAMLGSVTVSGQTPGPTPFIARVGVQIERADLVRSVSYTVTPRPGTVSRPVSVTYRNAYLTRRQLLDVANHRLDVPVFGLYAGYQNRISLQFTFADGSTRTADVLVDTPAYQEAVPHYTALDVKTPRQTGIALGYDFVFVKNPVTTPVVIDTDGNVRWVGSSSLNFILPSIFQGGRYQTGGGS